MKIESRKEHARLIEILKIAMHNQSYYKGLRRHVRWLASEIEAYEKEHWPIPEPTPAQARAFRREQERK